jgi:hypothetical protein
MTNVYIGELIEILPPHFKSPSIGKVVYLHPIKCKLDNGCIVDVSNCELRKLRRVI